MNSVQHKTYVLIKIISKSFFKPVVGDRLSTFHIKTAMLFTIETYPPGIWKECNLVQCVIYCLNTLIRWLKIKNCPHYTISNVNLFTGKLFKHELKVITEMINSMVTSDLQCIYEVQMDSLGARMSALILHLTNSENMSRKMINESISFEVVSRYHGRCYASTQVPIQNRQNLEWYQYVQAKFQDIITLVNISERASDVQHELFSVIIPHLLCTCASVQASRFIQLGLPITQDVLNLYKHSFDSDVLSSRLKFASMLYCCGQYEAAKNSLSYCEGLLGPLMLQCCACSGRATIIPNGIFLEYALNRSNIEILTKHMCNCIHFTRYETYCIPEFLVYEMFKTLSDADRQERHPAVAYGWMDLAVVDCEPFLHYLQFRTYRQLGQHNRAMEKLRKLDRYLGEHIQEDIGHGHIDTWRLICSVTVVNRWTGWIGP
ncbi:uncharacterized protein LOC128217812 [Mya arenaria]|uniref:uncharacterized protein LOC128217812 n=1 Tax=Mya arenaria TaxID=6604 RepID=UPI0022E7DEB1|nr:uncharacterized protein LOC128217812 [Mya arenaria]